MYVQEKMSFYQHNKRIINVMWGKKQLPTELEDGLLRNREGGEC